MHLEVDIRILECDFVMCGGFFSLFLISAKNMCWEWRWKSLKNTWLDTGLAYRGPFPIIGTFETISVSSCSSRGVCQRASASRHLRTTLSLYWHWVGAQGQFCLLHRTSLGKSSKDVAKAELIDWFLPHCMMVTGKEDLEWALILVLPSIFPVLTLCFLTGKHDYFCIHGWWALLLCLRRQLVERDTWIHEKGRTKPVANHFPRPTPSFVPSFTLGTSLRQHSTHCVVLWLTAVLWMVPCV